nr:hypothetical protein Ade03nite_70730 [Actinoplanes derwentensis]
MRPFPVQAGGTTGTVRRLEQAGLVRRSPSVSGERVTIVGPAAARLALRHEAVSIIFEILDTNVMGS